MKSYLDGKRRELDAFKFADFHLLVYLSELVDVETAVAAADCVRYKKPIPEGLTVILQAILG